MFVKLEKEEKYGILVLKKKIGPNPMTRSLVGWHGVT